MQRSECTSARAPSQWSTFWTLGSGETCIDAQVTHMWQGQPITALTLHRYRPTVHCIRLRSRRELRQFFNRFGRWDHDLWYWDSNGSLRRVPGSIDHQLLDCLMWAKKPMTVDDWQMVVCKPPAKIDFDDLPDWRSVLKAYPKTRRKYMGTAPVGKRSSALWSIMSTLAEQGASADEIASVAVASKAYQSKAEEIRSPHRWLERQIRKVIRRAN